MNLNTRQIGLGYLEESKKKGNESRIGKSSSVHAIRETQTDRIPYRNYL